MRSVPYEYVSVLVAAETLRVNPHTLYRACRRGEIPCTRLGNMYRIHVSFLLLEYVPPPSVTRYDSTHDPDQYEFEYDVPVRGIRRYRNGDVRSLGDYETSLSKKKWRNPSAP